MLSFTDNLALFTSLNLYSLSFLSDLTFPFPLIFAFRHPWQLFPNPCASTGTSRWLQWWFVLNWSHPKAHWHPTPYKRTGSKTSVNWQRTYLSKALYLQSSNVSKPLVTLRMKESHRLKPDLIHWFANKFAKRVLCLDCLCTQVQPLLNSRQANLRFPL